MLCRCTPWICVYAFVETKWSILYNSDDVPRVIIHPHMFTLMKSRKIVCVISDEIFCNLVAASMT